MGKIWLIGGDHPPVGDQVACGDQLTQFGGRAAAGTGVCNHRPGGGHNSRRNFMRRLPD